ncbi:MAG TPA: hypothetical protein VLZ11_01005 [Flavobacterium sp.]|nr:hypothetical protein [Flavobacterium sp.]
MAEYNKFKSDFPNMTNFIKRKKNSDFMKKEGIREEKTAELKFSEKNREI